MSFKIHQIWTSPEEFIPDRFMPGGEGGGVRLTIGIASSRRQTRWWWCRSVPDEGSARGWDTPCFTLTTSSPTSSRTSSGAVRRLKGNKRWISRRTMGSSPVAGAGFQGWVFKKNLTTSKWLQIFLTTKWLIFDMYNAIYDIYYIYFMLPMEFENIFA